MSTGGHLASRASLLSLGRRYGIGMTVITLSENDAVPPVCLYLAVNVLEPAATVTRYVALARNAAVVLVVSCV